MNMKTTNKVEKGLMIVLMAAIAGVICIGGVSLGVLPLTLLTMGLVATSSVVFGFCPNVLL